MRRISLISTINVAALAAVMLAILGLMMSGFWPEPPRHSTLGLVTAIHAIPMRKADRQDALKIMVAKDGRTFFGLERVRLEQLHVILRQGLINGAEAKVYISVDRQARYRAVLEVLDEIQAA